VTLFHVCLRLQSPLGTPLHSGTLFGQLCWTRREYDGEAALDAWLADEEQVWALSDGVPAGLLPRPVVTPAPPSEEPKVADDRKKRKKRGYIRREAFVRIRGGVSEKTLGPHLVAVADRSATFVHNTIDRRTGSTPETGGLYFLKEDWSFSPPDPDRAERLPDGQVEAGDRRDIYIEAPKQDTDDIRRLLSALGENGYGRDASLGRGRWTVESVTEDKELANGPNGRLLSLSHGSAEPDMDDLRCRLATHYGKAGPEVAVGGGASPFKKPLLLTQPGATFKGVAGRRYGALIRGVHPDRPEIIHNAFHVAIPFAEGHP
jgi:CRISPR-associated protein Csm4